ncbi:MAG: RNA 2',3'-cyclic phosphodiesterase [Ignavibacteriales bacterium CG_4_9_14_3_um_filter_30_11]|nr:MAG: RNA 2',3'-cyclic phosphodiesterase [Ignavibacteriales bacterium CG_4_9_14_3_um_filter_30_11]
MNRIFIALKIPKNIQEEIITICIDANRDYNNFKWESVNKLHITLKFIGVVEDNDLEKIIDSLSFISNYKILNCSFNKFGFFFRNNEPKILWLNIKTDPVILKLVEEINNSLEKFSIKKDFRKFKSHITLLRIKQRIQEKFVDSFVNYKLPEVNFIANEIAIMKSKLLPTGSVYNDIKIFKLT